METKLRKCLPFPTDLAREVYRWTYFRVGTVFENHEITYQVVSVTPKRVRVQKLEGGVLTGRKVLKEVHYVYGEENNFLYAYITCEGWRISPRGEIDWGN